MVAASGLCHALEEEPALFLVRARDRGTLIFHGQWINVSVSVCVQLKIDEAAALVAFSLRVLFVKTRNCSSSRRDDECAAFAPSLHVELGAARS